MTDWCDGFTVLDTDSTSSNPRASRLLSATMVALPPGQAPQVTRWLAQPVKLSTRLMAEHGVCVKDRPRKDRPRPAGDVVEEIATALDATWDRGYPLVAYNARWHLSVLHHELMRHRGMPLVIGGPVVDPLVVDRHVDPRRTGSRRLADMCRHYRVRVTAEPDPVEDCVSVACVLWRIARYFPEVSRLTPRELTDKCVEWNRGQEHAHADRLRNGDALRAQREAEELDYQGDHEAAEQKHAEALDINAHARTVDATAGQWPICVGGTE